MELPSGKGFADVVYLPRKNVNKPALVVELKWNKSAQGAIQQIKQKNYAAWIEGYTGDILLVGINYHKKRKLMSVSLKNIIKIPDRDTKIKKHWAGNCHKNTAACPAFVLVIPSPLKANAQEPT